MYEEYYDVLSNSPFCRGIGMQEYEKFLKSVAPTVREYNRNDYVVREGDAVNGCFMVLQGEVLQLRSTATGEKSVYDRIQPGQMFGEVILMLPNRKSWATDYIARSQCKLLFFEKKTILNAELDPAVFTNRIYQNYVYCVCKYAEKQMIALRCLRNTSVRQKIATYIYEMYCFYGQTQLELPLNRTELAAYLFMPQSSLSREMAKMKQDGIIDYYRDVIKILDLDRLKN